MPERLQKILAQGGFGSRRECENLILEGRVEVDRKTVVELGTKVDPENQSIRVDGQKLKIAFKKYFAVNKPRGVISTSKDPSGRPRVIDLIPTDQRVYTVGRLDKDSEGLIIVTNDGSLANRLTHPRFGIEKTYMIQVEGHPTREQMESLVAGVYLADGFVQIKHFQFKRKQKHTTEIEIVLDEGRNREVRRLLAKIGHKVLFLRRIAIGSFEMEGIPFGGNRQLTQSEVEQLAVNPKRRQEKSSGKRKSSAATKRSGSKTARKESKSSRPAAKKKSIGSRRPAKKSATTGVRKTGKKPTGKKSASKKSRATAKTSRKKPVRKASGRKATNARARRKKS